MFSDTAYRRMLARIAAKYQDTDGLQLIDRSDLRKIAFLLVRREIHKPCGDTIKDLAPGFSIYRDVTDILATLTPQEFLNIFPPAKNYDGIRHGNKDYFTTMEAINKLPPHVSIGRNINIMDLICDYLNSDIELFAARGMTLTAGLIKLAKDKEAAETVKPCRT